jgi:hypothetical protein
LVQCKLMGGKSMATQSTGKRPFGVTVIIVLQLITVLELVADILAVQAGQPSLFLQEIRDPQLVLGVELVTTLVLLAISLGLWRLQRWAWFLIMIQLGVSMASNLWRYANGVPLHLNMLLNVIMVFYLNQREVQHAFHGRAELGEAA